MEQNQSHQEFWDEKYSSKDKIWSGKVNAALEKYAQSLEPGQALDLGCGEGGDSIWLAKKGWKVTACDISNVALDRAKTEAIKNEVEKLITFEQHDLRQSLPDGEFELVSSHFFQSPIEFDRSTILKKVMEKIVKGGYLLLVDHGAAPPWSDHKDHVFLSPQETLEELELDQSEWNVVHLETFERDATGPDGQQGHLIDNVLLLQKASAQ